MEVGIAIGVLSMKILMNIMTKFHLIFVHMIDSRFVHQDDKAESTDDKNDDGKEDVDNVMTEMILEILNFDYLHPPVYT